MKTLRVNEMFVSLQGEGHRVGTSNFFIRLSGCNLTCTKEGEAGFDCDTEFTSGSNMTIMDIEKTMDDLLEKDGCVNPKNIIWTGGEPSMQFLKDQEIPEYFHQNGYFQSIETNGTIDFDPSQFDFISCSPKSAEHTMRIQHANELRYVRSVGQSIPKPTIQAEHHFISPAFEADLTVHPMTMRYCITMVKTNPSWRLSVQAHKLWKVQ